MINTGNPVVNQKEVGGPLRDRITRTNSASTRAVIHAIISVFTQAVLDRWLSLWLSFRAPARDAACVNNKRSPAWGAPFQRLRPDRKKA